MVVHGCSLHPHPSHTEHTNKPFLRIHPNDFTPWIHKYALPYLGILVSNMWRAALSNKQLTVLIQSHCSLILVCFSQHVPPPSSPTVAQISLFRFVFLRKKMWKLWWLCFNSLVQFKPSYQQSLIRIQGQRQGPLAHCKGLLVHKPEGKMAEKEKKKQWQYWHKWR